MKVTPTSVRVKVTIPELGEHAVSYMTSPTVDGTPEKTVTKLNQLAKRKGLNTTYELATEAEYWNYRNSHI